MGLPTGRLDPVGRYRHLASLQPFLQGRFRVLAPAFQGGFGQQGLEQSQHQVTGGLEAGIKVDRTDDGLQRIGQNRGALGASALGLAFAEAHDLGQAQLHRQAVQHVLAHQMGSDAGEVALVTAVEAAVEQARHTETEYGVAQELEALVVLGPEALVGHGPHQQAGVGKHVPQPLLQRLERLGNNRATGRIEGGHQNKAGLNPGPEGEEQPCIAGRITWTVPRT